MTGRAIFLAACLLELGTPPRAQPLSVPAKAAKGSCPKGQVQLERVSVIVEGVAIPFTVFGIIHRLGQIRCASNVRFSLTTGEAVFDIPAGCGLANEEIRAAVRDASYTPGPISRTIETDPKYLSREGLGCALAAPSKHPPRRARSASGAHRAKTERRLTGDKMRRTSRKKDRPSPQ